MRVALALLALIALAPAAAACGGISPGDQIATEEGSCTLAFIHANADGLYFSTAGHCVILGQGIQHVASGKNLGTAVMRYLEPFTDDGLPNDGRPGDDFGLILIDPALYGDLNPKMCGWDGPYGIYDDAPGSGGVRHYGHGVVIGDLEETRGREGAALYNENNVAFYWVGAGVSGDSGSGVLHESGAALGVLTHLRISAATNGGTHLYRGYELAAAQGITGLRLVNADEDPVAVLAEMRAGGAPDPVPGTPTAPSPAPTTPPGSPPPSNPPSKPPTTSGNASANATLNATADGESGGDGSGSVVGAAEGDAQTPGVGIVLVALAAIGAAIARRRA